MRVARHIITFLVALTLGCSQEQRSTIESLRAVGERVEAKAGTKRVQVELHNETSMFLTITNSGWNDVSREKQSAFARQAAEAAMAGYENSSVRTIHVRLASRHEFLAFHVGGILFKESFEVSELRKLSTSGT